MSIKDLYEQELYDHYQHPRNFGVIEGAGIASPLYNPSCGDRVMISANVDQGVAKEVRFEGKGCVLSIAMASKLTERCKGVALSDILLWDDAIVLELLKMKLGPKRIQCGMLPLVALQKGIKSFLDD